MKKQYSIFTLLAFLFIASFSCEDLEEEPVGLLNPEAFYKTPSDVLVGLNGAYSAIASEEFYGRKLSLSLLLRSDMVTIGDQGTSSRRIDVDQFNMSADNGMVSKFWPKGYEALAAVNYAVEGAANIDADEEVRKALIAEGYFIRAFIHFHFVRLFGNIPYIDFPFKDPELAYNLKETNVDDVYAGIIADLEYAKEWLPDQQNTRARASKGAAAALLASVQLTRGNWQAAYDEAKYVIDNAGAFGYALEPDFQALFDASLPESSPEVIFEIDFRGNDQDAGGNYSRDYMASVTGIRGDSRHETGEGWSVAVPSMEVYNSWDSRDYRKAVSFDTVTLINDDTVHYSNWDQVPRGVARPHIAKYFRYPGKSGINARDSDQDYPVIRYAEVLLIAAEAANELNGPTAEAIGFVNQVRERARRELDGDAATNNAYPEDVTTGQTQDSFRDLVLNERRLELAFEFGRWYDIVRRQLGEESFGPGTLEPDNAFKASRDYLFPKFAGDLDRNENLKQNDGY
ncbi:RagB/SusD family nutrient uptake outer membrane protein [Marinoscillum furvescens]|uniref:Putative outer membrane starch-binding protein n=1 Tax=Marinoscillum furvescens DSM 4134 TaxID=1122208 RepID=A0A3D9KXK2_MARFU|nr:RagB/SusD family nutrient uptake outer membrane protein [Marinoscillum furvescens]RED93828.1 putative outer membrane starch-binding protein [Marinoscillum furvescens DSM 4134]